MSTRWERAVVVQEPLLTPRFLLFVMLAVVGFILTLYRELVGLGPVTGLNDGYTWGLFKNFNVTTLTAMGSGGYAVGVLTWLLNRKKYHVIMRTAVLTSMLSYTTGMVALGVDVGRPWNILWIVNPLTWNEHSILLDVALCMTAYVILGLDIENAPPVFEVFHYGRFSIDIEKLAAIGYRALKMVYPFLVALAFVLPTMHQSSLGTLMMLAGPRVHPIWQTPLLPLLYLGMAIVLGFCCVLLTLFISCAVWKRPLDMEVLSSLAGITSWVAIAWVGLRIFDLNWRGQLGEALSFDYYSRFFLLEIALILTPALALRVSSWRHNPVRVMRILLLLAAGGMLYRYTPTTIAFVPGDNYTYFPSVTEILMSVGFAATAVAGYIAIVKKFAILPAPLSMAIGSTNKLFPEATAVQKAALLEEVSK